MSLTLILILVGSGCLLRGSSAQETLSLGTKTKNSIPHDNNHKNQQYYSPESYGKINHKNHQPASYAFAFPTVASPDEPEDRRYFHRETASSSSDGTHAEPSPSSLTSSSKLPSSSPSSKTPLETFPAVSSSSSSVNLASTSTSSQDDNMYSPSESVMETLEEASSLDPPSRAGQTSSYDGIKRAGGSESFKLSGMTDGRKTNSGGHGLTTESPVVSQIPRPPTSFDSFDQMTTSSPPVELSKKTSSYGISSHFKPSSLSSNAENIAVNPTRFSAPISSVSPLQTHSSPSSSIYNTNQIASKSNHASRLQVEGERKRLRKKGSKNSVSGTRTSGGSRLDNNSEHDALSGSISHGQGDFADEDEEHIGDAVEETSSYNKQRNPHTQEYSNNDNDEEEEVQPVMAYTNTDRKQQHHQSDMTTRTKGGIMITSPPSDASSLSSTRVLWTGLQHGSSFASPPKTHSSNFDETNFTRDAIDWSAILSNYQRSNESFNTGSLQDLMNHVVSSSVTRSPSSVVTSPHEVDGDQSSDNTESKTINLGLSLKRGGYAVAQLSSNPTSLPVTSYSSPVMSSDMDSGFTPLVRKRKRPSNNSKITSSSSSSVSSTASPLKKTPLTGTTTTHRPKIYLEPTIDLEDESSSGEGVAVDPNKENNNQTSNKGNNNEESEDDPPSDIYANIGEDSVEAELGNNNANYYGPAYYESLAAGNRYSQIHPRRPVSPVLRNYLRRPYAFSGIRHASHSPSMTSSSPSSDYYSSSAYPLHSGGYYNRYYSRNNNNRYHLSNQADLSSSSSSPEMNHADPVAENTSEESPSSDDTDKTPTPVHIQSPYPYYDPSLYYGHTYDHTHEGETSSSSSPYYLSHRHESGEGRPPGFPSWSGLTGFLLGIIPLSLLVASIVPAFVTVPVASSAAAAAAGRRRRRRSLDKNNVDSFVSQERSNRLQDILEILQKILESPPT